MKNKYKKYKNIEKIYSMRIKIKNIKKNPNKYKYNKFS